LVNTDFSSLNGFTVAFGRANDQARLPLWSVAE
jgi:hypothetical protein